MSDFFFTHTKELCWALMLLAVLGSFCGVVLWGLVASAPL